MIQYKILRVHSTIYEIYFCGGKRYVSNKPKRFETWPFQEHLLSKLHKFSLVCLFFKLEVHGQRKKPSKTHTGLHKFQIYQLNDSIQFYTIPLCFALFWCAWIDAVLLNTLRIETTMQHNLFTIMTAWPLDSIH